VFLAALAARVVGRPLKLVLTRPQMFTVGHRPETRQRVRLGATRDGRLVAVDHHSTATLGTLDDGGVEPVTQVTGNAYSCPNVATHDRRARLNIPSPYWMRAPGTTQGNFALESALDELSYAVGIDPIELRLRNYAEVHPGSGLPWSSKALRECYRVGAERFGWAGRPPEIGSMRDGNWLVGHGMAGATMTSGQARCEATVSTRGAERRKLGPGDYFGEIALIDDGARSATVTADSELRCYGLTSWEFRPLVESNASIAWKLLETMAKRLRSAQRN